MRLNTRLLLGMSEARPVWARIAGPFVWHVETHIAELETKQGNVDEAIKAVRRFTDQIAASAPADVEGTALYNYACILALAGKADGAIAALGKAFALDEPDRIVPTGL
ncbi:MAG: hypothetical protein M1482_12255 [Chloroflexi bacterium]|nr:hypothetical protein [Chloroflexota bacterium]